MESEVTERFAFWPEVLSVFRRASITLGVPIAVIALVPILVVALGDVASIDFSRAGSAAGAFVAVATVAVAVGVVVTVRVIRAAGRRRLASINHSGNAA